MDLPALSPKEHSADADHRERCPAGFRDGFERMRVGGQLAVAERQAFDAPHLAEIDAAQAEALAETDAEAAPQVREAEGGLAVAAVGGAQQGEQRRVLRDGEELALAEGPAAGREGAGEEADLAEQGFLFRAAAA